MVDIPRGFLEIFVDDPEPVAQSEGAGMGSGKGKPPTAVAGDGPREPLEPEKPVGIDDLSGRFDRYWLNRLDQTYSSEVDSLRALGWQRGLTALVGQDEEYLVGIIARESELDALLKKTHLQDPFKGYLRLVSRTAIFVSERPGDLLPITLLYADPATGTRGLFDPKVNLHPVEKRLVEDLADRRSRALWDPGIYINLQNNKIWNQHFQAMSEALPEEK